ncbi:MAG: hypothetical protein R3D84_14780 [Paracoccaceae bacterium]
MTNAFRGLILSAALCLANPGAQAQDLARWGDLHGFLVQSLAPNRMSEVFFWLPDNPDPAQAREAIGVVYPISMARPAMSISSSAISAVPTRALFWMERLPTSLALSRVTCGFCPTGSR